jgi:hypothetical protein
VVVALIVHRIVAVWTVPWFTLIMDGLYLDRYVLRTCYGVGVYYNPVPVPEPEPDHMRVHLAFSLKLVDIMKIMKM